MRAETILAKELRRLGWKEGELSQRAKSDPGKDGQAVGYINGPPTVQWGLFDRSITPIGCLPTSETEVPLRIEAETLDLPLFYRGSAHLVDFLARAYGHCQRRNESGLNPPV